MEFRQLEAFVAIAETKGFSKAANLLYLSQSTISSHIKNLEKELDAKLILRSTKNVILTEEGNSFLFYAKRMLATRDVALYNIHNKTDSFIRLGASTIPSSYLLPDILTKFRKKYENVFFDIRQGDSGDIHNYLLDGTVELGIVGGKENNSKFEYIEFYKDDMVVITPSNSYYLDLKKKNVDITELLKEPIILREQGSGSQKSAMKFLDSVNISGAGLNVVARNNDIESIKKMVAMGMGISIISGLAIENLKKQGQLLVFPINTDITRHFYLCYLKDKDIKPIIDEFMKFIKRYCSKL